MTDIKTHLSQLRLDSSRGYWKTALDSVTSQQVQAELQAPAGRYSIHRLVRLLSPAARDFLEPMAQQARTLTRQRFGKTIALFEPLYVSNVCVNSCVYCGFNRTSNVPRTQLTIEQAMSDARAIAEQGFRDILLVSGEDPKFASVEYFCELARQLRPLFSSISVEIYPLGQSQYQQLLAAGIDGVTVFQETYDRQVYECHHPAGPKRNFDWRLECPDRFASVGMRRIGLGVLLGLTDWRLDTLAMAEHAAYLMKRYWRSSVSFSFPRMRPAANVIDQWPHVIDDTDLVQMMLALRLCFADAGIVLSTRERPELRDQLIHLCVTRMSAGARTNPGGYTRDDRDGSQFEVADTRSPSEIAQRIRQAGYEPVWKDWDAAFCEPQSR